jgi:hypothetical protein
MPENSGATDWGPVAYWFLLLTQRKDPEKLFYTLSKGRILSVLSLYVNADSRSENPKKKDSGTSALPPLFIRDLGAFAF